MARKSGTPLSTLHAYSTGQDMKLSQVVALADACGVSVEWLARGRGPMRQQEQPVATERPTEANVAAVREAITPRQASPDQTPKKPEVSLFPITEFFLLANCINHVFAKEKLPQVTKLPGLLKWAIDLYDNGGPVVQAVPFDQLPESAEGDNAESGGPRSNHGE